MVMNILMTMMKRAIAMIMQVMMIKAIHVFEIYVFITLLRGD